MARIPKRLAGPSQLAAAAATLYTVASSRRGIIRHIHLSNPTGSAATKFTISIGTDGASKRIFDVYPLAAGATYDHYCYHVLEAAEVIQAFADSASAIVITINGDEEILA